MMGIELCFLEKNSIHILKNQCRPFPFCNIATHSMFFQMSAYNTRDTYNNIAMSSCFIPAVLMAILHILSSFAFVELSNIRVLRLFHDSTAKEIHTCIPTPGQYCVVSFSVMDSSE